ncbi:MAG: fibronectin type III domain-containing protein [Anaerolineae bacterium]
MMRVCLATLGLLVALSASTFVAADAQGVPVRTVPLQITQGPADHLNPHVAVQPDGRVLVSWIEAPRDEGPSRLMAALSSDWKPLTIADLAEDAAFDPQPQVYAGAATQVAWLQSGDPFLQVFQMELGAALVGPLELTLPTQITLAYDSQGGLHAAWFTEGTLNALDVTRGLTATLATDAVVEAPALALDGQAVAHLAWVTPQTDASTGPVHYVALRAESEPMLVTESGRNLHLQVGSGGLAHLTWQQDGTLYYARSDAWENPQIVAANLPEDEVPSTLAIGSDGVAHAVWYSEGSLWYANSVDWSMTRTLLATTGSLSGLSLALDRRGWPQVAWSAPDADGISQIYQLSLQQVLPQMRVVSPAEGDVLTNDGLAEVDTTLPADELVRITFYVEAGEEGLNQQGGALMELGSDDDPADGWSVPLPLAELAWDQRCRVLAFGAMQDGAVMQARGGWFTVRAEGLPWVWLQGPFVEASQGQSALGVMAADAASEPDRLDLFLSPEAPPNGQTDGVKAAPDLRYVGSYRLPRQIRWPAPVWQWLSFDSSAIPDGAYAVTALITDAEGQHGYSALDTLRVQNNQLPEIEIVEPEAGAVVANRLTITAQAPSQAGFITRMDFFVERSRPLLALQSQRYQEETSLPELTWIGSDSDGSDGWAVERAVTEALDGDDWQVYVVAFGEKGPLGEARSEASFIILGRRRPYVRLSTPAAGSQVSGVEEIRLDVLANTAHFTGATVYLEGADGGLTPLGDVSATEEAFSLSWDTRAARDGVYAVVAAVRDDQGRTTMARAEGVIVRNQTVPLAFVPADDGGNLPGTLSGTAVLRILATDIGPTPQRVDAYLQDERGALYTIGQALFRDKPVLGWSTIWDTRSVMDGRYRLIAVASYTGGWTSRAVWDVTVQNTSPTITLSEPTAGEVWAGARRIQWTTVHPLGLATSVTIAYSPDGGAHWAEVASGLDASDSYVWDTAQFPDGADARLRLTASDGLQNGRVTSPAFAVANRNQAPRVSLLSPQADTLHGQEVLITWQAWDPDGSELGVDLTYRTPDGDWLPIALDLANSGHYVWSLKNVVPRDDYTLRVVARDTAGLSSVALVGGISIVDSQPPQVRLLAPSSSARLKREAVILWQATDPDGDALRIDLYYSDDAGRTWIPLAEGLANTGYYTWQVSFLPVGSKYRIRVVARDGLFQSSHESPWLFAVGDSAPPQVTLTAPAAGSTLSGPRWIRWYAADPDGTPVTTTLSLRLAGSSEWLPLAENLPSDGFYLWDTTQFADGAYDLRVSVSDGSFSASAALAQTVTLANGTNLAPQVALIAPLGGETWSGMQEIRWRAWDQEQDPITATLYLSTDDGAWQELTQVDGYAGRYLWDTDTAPLGDTYRVRVAVNDGARRGAESAPGVFHLENARALPPTVTITSPDSAGELLHGDTVAWIAESPNGAALGVSIALSSDDGRTWETIAEGLSNTGEYTLDSALLEDSTPRRIRLRVHDARYVVQAFSPAFAPAEPRLLAPELTLHEPQGDETWSGVRTIRWTALDPGDQALRILVERSADGGYTWKRIGTSTENSGTMNWDTTDDANGIYVVRVTADNGQARVSQQSGPLVVSNSEQSTPVISVIYPRGGQVWSGTQEVRWSASGDPESTLGVDLSYSLDGGASWGSIARGVPNTGSYIWDTTVLPNCSAVWLRASVSDGRATVTDVSDGSFAVRNVLAPVVVLLSPQGGERWAGRQTIAWYATTGSLRPVQVTLEISADGGLTWRLLASGLSPSGTYLAATDTYAVGSGLLIRATATDGSRSGVDVTTKPVVIQTRSGSPLWQSFLP